MKYDASKFLSGLFVGETGRSAVGVAEPIPLSNWSDIGVEDLPSDWRVWFEERAAIMEYHGGLSCELAEAQALAETVQTMRAWQGIGLRARMLTPHLARHEPHPKGDARDMPQGPDGRRQRA